MISEDPEELERLAKNPFVEFINPPQSELITQPAPNVPKYSEQIWWLSKTCIADDENSDINSNSDKTPIILNSKLEYTNSTLHQLDANINSDTTSD